MNKNIGTLTIEMAANIARLQQGMDQANKYISRAMGGIQQAAGLASTALGLIGAGICSWHRCVWESRHRYARPAR